MFSNGNATVFVSDMDRSVKFYTDVLGLRLAQRFGNHWAAVEAGTLAIGLHPASTQHPPGREGSTVIGLEVSGEIDEAVATLTQHGVRIRGAVLQDEAGKTVYFEDPDGNLLYMIQLIHWSQAGAPAYAHEAK